jgi:hypothetical protein
VATLVDPRDGRPVWKSGFPKGGRNVAGGGSVLAATATHALCTWMGGGGIAGLFDLESGQQTWSYPFSTTTGGHQLGKAAFLGGILNNRAVVVTAQAEGREKKLQVHFIDLASGKGDVQIVEGAKSEEHERYGGCALRGVGDGVLLNDQAGLYCFGGRKPE